MVRRPPKHLRRPEGGGSTFLLLAVIQGVKPRTQFYEF